MQVHTPPMQFSTNGQDAWEQWLKANTDPYGFAVLRYASEWATLMEKRLAAGESVRQCADECSHQADTEGITGFMYGVAISVLKSTWKHGDELLEWHNNRTQLNGEGAEATKNGRALNPALLRIET